MAMTFQAKEESVSVQLAPASSHRTGRIVMAKLSAPTATGHEGDGPDFNDQGGEQIEGKDESTLMMMTKKEKEDKEDVIIPAMTKEELTTMINSLVQLCYYYIFAPSF